jgi:hypothetical protein
MEERECGDAGQEIVSRVACGETLTERQVHARPCQKTQLAALFACVKVLHREPGMVRQGAW